LPYEPTVYVCAQDRDEAEHRNPAGPERLLLIVNAPARGDAGPFEPEEIARCESQTFRLMERCGLRLDPDRACTVRTTPHDFERLFPASGGALYGQASHGWMASFSRPGARSKLPGLYLAGGSTHPGPGVPMAALSGRQAAASALADLATARRRDTGSTHRSKPAVMPGGTSMP
jgi:1-hydroxycarotenoid 3,4-desaturase